VCAGKIPLVTSVSDGGDAGRPIMVQSKQDGEEVRDVMRRVAENVWGWLGKRSTSSLGMRG
jgi:ATP-binding protein involved in chromosome partitioning